MCVLSTEPSRLRLFPLQTAGVFHHVVVTYTGQSGSPAYTETIYVDGVQNQQYNRQLSILRIQNPLLGGYSDPENGDFALAVLRVHDGCLTAAQVSARWQWRYSRQWLPGDGR
jgi:hypothetical protein